MLQPVMLPPSAFIGSKVGPALCFLTMALCMKLAGYKSQSGDEEVKPRLSILCSSTPAAPSRIVH